MMPPAYCYTTWATQAYFATMPNKLYGRVDQPTQMPKFAHSVAATLQNRFDDANFRSDHPTV